MGEIFSILVFLVPALLITALGMIIFKLWGKGRGWRLISVAIPLIILGLIYDAIYPADSFYVSEFEKVSGLHFPKSGVIKGKYSTYPDIHGDYVSCALIEVSVEDYAQLKTKLLLTQAHKIGEVVNFCGDIKLKETPAPRYAVATDKLWNEKSSEEFGWGLLENTSLVYFFYWSS